MIEIVFKWQTLIGALIGASAPFLLWFATEFYRRKIKREQDLYYLVRLLTDQLNNVADMKLTVENFMKNKFSELLININNYPSGTYSASRVFFPLFSVRKMPQEVNRINSGSGYLDENVARAYSLSNDLPDIVEDLRKQLNETLDKGDTIAFNKITPPDQQKGELIKNLKLYQKMVEDDFLKKSLPVIINRLAISLVVAQEKVKVGHYMWLLKFSPKYRFFLSKKKYKKALENFGENMDKRFSSKAEKIVQQINAHE